MDPSIIITSAYDAVIDEGKSIDAVVKDATNKLKTIIHE
jgi:hypothetical protein